MNRLSLNITFDVGTRDCSDAKMINNGGDVLKYKLPIESKKNGLSIRADERKFFVRHE